MYITPAPSKISKKKCTYTSKSKIIPSYVCKCYIKRYYNVETKNSFNRQ